MIEVNAMEISKKDSEIMKRLAKEGKQIAKILSDDFPELNYWDIYIEVYGGGQRSALGVMRMISNRLIKLNTADDKTKKALIDEISELVSKLYNNYMSNQQKLEKIRNVLEEK